MRRHHSQPRTRKLTPQARSSAGIADAPAMTLNRMYHWVPRIISGLSHWLSPLMILGTQWYILFNVIAGASAIPAELRACGVNFRVRGWLWWRRIALPAVFPYYVTGAITASGGSWNASIVAEVASWGDTKLQATGLGAYIADATDKGDMARVVLGVVVMSAFVVLFNRLLWRPMYSYAQRRLTLG